MRVTLCGPFGGYASYNVVMRGLARGLQNHGFEIIKASSTGDGDVSAEDVKKLNAGVLPGFDVGVVLVINPPFLMTSGLNKLGTKVVGLHVGDVDRIPYTWALAMDNEDLVITPSKWLKSVFTEHVKPEVLVVHHGVEPIYRENQVVEPNPSEFTLLHFCSSGVFPDRKGTFAVLEAMDEHPFELTLVVSEVRSQLKQAMEKQSLNAKDRTSVLLRPYGTTPQELVELYQSHHVLLVPSRAEGFGIQSLEARSLGCVVAQTLCTGHEDHFNFDEVPLDYGVVPIPHGPLSEAWGDYGRAPTVKTESVVAAIHYASQNYRQLRYNAVASRPQMKRWSWDEVTEELAERLKTL